MATISFLVAFVLCFVANLLLLPVLKKAKANQEILQYVTEHNSKKGTPTMGGISFILAIAIVASVFCDLSVKGVAVSIAVFVGYGIVGFLDDFVKIKQKRNLGLKAYQKILVQVAIAVLVALFVFGDGASGSSIRIPFTDKQVQIGFWVVPFVIFVYLACTNGVNLTDGIDGLATTTTLAYLVGMILLLNGEATLLDAKGDTYALEQVNNIITLCYVSCGALLAFLFFNCFDAKVFMGDTGSLALGALVACVAIFSRMTLFIPIVGVMFVVSCVSVIMQVAYFKLTGGKRVFLMAPFHHHLQKKGWSETRICVCYGTITLLAVAVLMIFGG